MEESSARIEKAAEQFLLTGHINGIDASVLAEACSNIIKKQSDTSLEIALVTAKKFAKYSKKKDAKTRYTALRSLARINHLISNYKEAKSAYLSARKMAKKNPVELAAIDRALIDLYMYLGNFSESQKRAKMALGVYRRLNSKSDIAKTTVNYANLLHRQDRHRDAERLYHEAADYFKSLGDALSLARCYYNRANALVQLFELDAAESLYLESNDIYLKHDHTIDANDAMYGLAWLRMLKGDYHIALLNLTECEKVFKEAGHTRMAALCELDRAEVYLYLNLLTDGLEAARQAEKVFDGLKVQYEASKSAFFRARAAHALKMPQEAGRSLKKAIKGFQIEKNSGFLAAALLLKSQSVLDNKSRRRLIDSARRKFKNSQLPLWEAICNVYLGSEKEFKEIALSRLKKNAAVHHVPHLFAQWQTLEGDLALSRRKFARAKEHWRIAADCLDRVRAQLPPVELRSNYGAADLSPHRRLISLESKTSPIQAAVWSERYRTAGIWTPLSSDDDSKPERRRIEKSLTDLANRVSSYSQQIRGLAGERGQLVPDSQSPVIDLQKRVRQEIAHVEKSAPGDQHLKGYLKQLYEEESNFRPIVQFHSGKTDILAFVHWQGETILKRYPHGRETLARLLQQWRFLLEHESLQKHLGSKSDVDSEQKLFDKLGEWLWKPLEISKEHGQILILPESDIANVPWQALRVGNRPLLEQHSFVLAPSLRHFSHARNVKTESSEVRVYVGKSEDLPQVRKELSVLSKLADKDLMIANPSKRDDWPKEGSSRLWHYSGHAFLRNDNPFYSYLALADGPLFAADFRLKNANVELVTLAACRSGEQVALSGEEATGLVRSILEMGSRNVIAGLWPVSDESTALWMEEFYSKYFGNTELGEAATSASIVVREKFPSAFHWSPFSIFGAGDRGTHVN